MTQIAVGFSEPGGRLPLDAIMNSFITLVPPIYLLHLNHSADKCICPKRCPTLSTGNLNGVPDRNHSFAISEFAMTGVSFT